MKYISEMFVCMSLAETQLPFHDKNAAPDRDARKQISNSNLSK